MSSHNLVFAALLLTFSFIAVDAQAKSHVDLRAAVEQVSASMGEDHPELYVSLEQLGLALQRDGLHAEAIDTFRRMQSLVHRQLGVYSPLQVPSIQHVIRSQVSQREYAAADQQQKFLYGIAAREHDATDPEMFNARRRLADWYRNTYRFDEALKLYEESRSYLSLQNDKTLAQTSLFLAEAETLYLSGRCCASTALEQAIEHITSITDAESRRRLHLDYADALMLESNTQAALQIYSQVVGAVEPRLLGLGTAREIDEARKRSRPDYNQRIEIFLPMRRESDWVSDKAQRLPTTVGSPVTLCASEFATIYDKNAFSNYVLDVEVHVDESGRAKHVNVQGNVPKELARYVHSVAKRSRYRPRIGTEGTAEPTVVAFQQTFAGADEHALTDDLSGWSRLLARRTCALIDRPFLTASK